MRLNFFLVKGLHIYTKITHCNLRQNPSNEDKYYNLFNDKYLYLCVLCELCGFEKSGLTNQPNYAKQSQFSQQQNEHNLLINKGI